MRLAPRKPALLLDGTKMWAEARAFGKPLLIMPSFNRLLGGATPGRIRSKRVSLEGAKLTLLDGTYLGEL